MIDETALRALFARWRAACVESLGEARAEIDALNVFPVPDADTGTNVYLTMEAAVRAADEVDRRGEPAVDVVRAFVDGALRDARGNSGVILSQLLRAAVLPLAAASISTPVDPRDPSWGTALAQALEAASTAAWGAVDQPVEGTILSVARAAAEAASSAGPSAIAATVIRVARQAAEEALERTPDQLERLRRAGVVDAGGRALVVVLEATEWALTGRRRAVGRGGSRHIPIPVPDDDLSPDGPAYEVMYLLDAPADALPGLRAALSPLGDSLVVVGGDGLWHVHVHVDDVGAAIEAGIGAGRPHRVRVTHFAEQSGQQRGAGQPGTLTRSRTVVTTAAGPGLADLFAQAGARVVTPSDGRRCSTSDLLAAVLESSAAEVVVLPNDREVVGAAEAAAQQAREHGRRVAVIPTHAQVQGLAALAVHEPGRGFDDDVVRMTAAAGHARHGAVTVATKRAITSAGPCEPGDVLGVVDGDFAVIGSDVLDTASWVLDRLLTGGGELVTVVAGAEAPADLVDRLEANVLAGRPDLDVVGHDGGQDRYVVLLAVE